MNLEKIDLKKILILMGIFILILFVLGSMLIKKSSVCDGNPFVYGAEKVKDMGLDIVCTCNFLQEGYNTITFDVNGLRQDVPAEFIFNKEKQENTALEHYWNTGIHD